MTKTLRILIVGVVLALTPHGLAQTGKSPAMAAGLVQLLEQARLDSFAMKVVGEADRYLAVLLVPKVQLLAVSVRYSAPDAMDARIAAKDYRGAYVDLNSSNVRQGKLFVMDLQADGLSLTRDANKPFDIVYENGVTQTMFDGDWKKQKLSETEYRRRFDQADARYAEILNGLATELKRSTTR
jgi:hypothetical protein